MSAYIFNLETLKIELHFDKADYIALDDSKKSMLKSAYLWSNSGKCWVSRAKEPNLYTAKKAAAALGFTDMEQQGERLTYAEQLERKAGRAEARADRYEQYASNAAARSSALQKPLESMRGDIAFFTQPIIAGHAGSRAFANRRERMYKQYERGMDEYRKSAYYTDRAATARATADNAKLSDKIYLNNRIKECNKNLNAMQKNIAQTDDQIFRINAGELVTGWDGKPLNVDRLEAYMGDLLDRYEAEQDKLNFFEDCMQSAGGVEFSRDNIKPGFIVNIARWGKCEVLSTGPKNFRYKIIEGRGISIPLTDSYAAITDIVTAKEAKEETRNPYAVGEILTLNRPADNSVYRAFQVLKVTDKTVQIQEIMLDSGSPVPGTFRPGSKPARKGITKSKYSDFVGAYHDDWQLHKHSCAAEINKA